MAAFINIYDTSKKVKELYVKHFYTTKEVIIGYENDRGIAKIIYQRSASQFEEVDIELGPGTYRIPSLAVGCAFQAYLAPSGGNVRLVVGGAAYNYSLGRGGSSGHYYRPAHSYEMIFPSVKHPNEERYLEISNDSNSYIRLKKWLTVKSPNETYLFWRGYREIQVSLAGGTHNIPSKAIGLIYKASPKGTFSVDYETPPKPLYYERYKSGGSGHGHDFGITGILYFPSHLGVRASRIMIGSGSFVIIAWLYENT